MSTSRSFLLPPLSSLPPSHPPPAALSFTPATFFLPQQLPRSFLHQPFALPQQPFTQAAFALPQQLPLSPTPSQPFAAAFSFTRAAFCIIAAAISFTPAAFFIVSAALCFTPAACLLPQQPFCFTRKWESETVGKWVRGRVEIGRVRECERVDLPA